MHSGLFVFGLLFLGAAVGGVLTNNVNIGSMPTNLMAQKCDYYSPLVTDSNGKPMCVWSEPVANLHPTIQPIVGILNTGTEVLFAVIGLFVSGTALLLTPGKTKSGKIE